MSTALDTWSLDRLGEEGAAGATTFRHNAVILSALWFLVLAGAVFLVHRARENRMAAFAPALNLMATLLVGVAAAQTIGSSSAPETHAGIVVASVDEPLGTSLPDVYYVVLDGYARADVLEEYYGHDNSPFLDALRSSGFTVNERSNANYYWTFLSLASSLNMDYVPAILGPVNRDSVDRRAAYEGIRNSAVSEILRNNGYRFMQLQSTWGATLENPHADTLVSCGSKLFADEFLRTLAEASWLRVLAAQASGSLAECHRQNFASTRQHRRSAGPEVRVRAFPLAAPSVFVRSTRQRAKRRLDFEPVPIFSRACGSSATVTWSSCSTSTTRCWRPSRKSKRNSNSRRPPIIVLQSDHGPQLINGLNETERQRVRLANLAAFHPPGRATGPDSAGRICRQFFSAHLELLSQNGVAAPREPALLFTRPIGGRLRSKT